MSRTMLAAAALTVVAAVSPLSAQTIDRLAFLIPNLYGSRGLSVASDRALPTGETHSAHFNSDFQRNFSQFNTSLASQLASVPLPSPASGFTYTLNPALGVFQRSTNSFGPIVAERAETIGKRKVSVGFNFQRFSFDSLEGVDLDDVPAVFTHDSPTPGGRADVVTTRNSIGLEVSQFTAFVNFGLSDRIDLSLAVPVLDVSLDVTSRATIQRVGTASDPAIHYFRTPSGGIGSEQTFTASGTASGVGDLIARAKLGAFKSDRAGLAVGVEVRFPTGDEENLLGSGTMGARPFLIMSYSGKVVSPHVNLSYQWNGDSLLGGDVITGEKGDLPDQFLADVGIDVGVTQRLTLALDLLGRRVIDSPRLQSQPFTTLQGGLTFPNITFLQGQSINVLNGAIGLKLNLAGRLLIDANVLVKLNEAGLRDRITPLAGLEYTF